MFLKVGSYLPIPDGKGHWVSKENLDYYSEKYDLYIRVPVGSVNDLASIPVPLRNLFPVNGPHRPAAVLHDYLYQVRGAVKGRRLTREQVDDIFFEAMQVSRDSYIGCLSSNEVSLLLRNPSIPKMMGDMTPLVSKWIAKLMYLGVRIGGGSHWHKKIT